MPCGASTPPREAENLPLGATDVPRGANRSPQGAHCPPLGSESLTQRAEDLPRGAEGPPRGAQGAKSLGGRDGPPRPWVYPVVKERQTLRMGCTYHSRKMYLGSRGERSSLKTWRVVGLRAQGRRRSAHNGVGASNARERLALEGAHSTATAGSTIAAVASGKQELQRHSTGI